MITKLPTITTPSLDHAAFYNVEAGDNLAIIEEKTGVPMETIRDLNVFGLQANDLRVGLKILIGFKNQVPVFYTVQEGDTIVGICNKAGISVESFSLINRLGEIHHKKDDIVRGQGEPRIRIPRICHQL